MSFALPHCRRDSVVLSHVHSLKEMLNDSDVTGAMLQRVMASILELVNEKGE